MKNSKSTSSVLHRSGKVDGMKYISYRSEPNVNPESTDRNICFRCLFVDTTASVMYLSFFRTGKRMTPKGTHVNIVFKQMDSIFGEPLATECAYNLLSNQLVDSSYLNGKEVGEEFKLAHDLRLTTELDATATGTPDPYEN